MPELGRAALLVTLGLSTYALVAGAYAAHLGRRRLARSAQNALVASFVSTAVAAGVLIAALLRNDFSFEYVARTTNKDDAPAEAFGSLADKLRGALKPREK